MKQTELIREINSRPMRRFFGSYELAESQMLSDIRYYQRQGYKLQSLDRIDDGSIIDRAVLTNDRTNDVVEFRTLA